jgi:hypothetical protein
VSTARRQRWHFDLPLTFLEQDAFEQGVLVPEHQTLVGGGAVALLEVLEGFFMMLDGGLQLFDVFSATFSKGRLCLTIPLLALFWRRIDLNGRVSRMRE